MPEYTTDRALIKNRTFGPHFESYVLRKTKGPWLIQKSTTARVNRPTPLLTGIGLETEARPGQQFFLRIAGKDIEPEMLYLEVKGAGMPGKRSQ